MTGNLQEPDPAGDGGQSPAQTSLAYQVTAGVVLLLIMALLAVLWVTERSARITAQVGEASMQQRRESIEAVLRDLMAGQGERPAIAIRRDELPARSCRLDGDERELLLLDARQGRRLGFAGGDLILIEREGPTPQTPGGAP